jgi:hypothetical protein
MLYDLREVRDLVRLATLTLQSYTSRGKTDRVRGEDFFVRRTSPYRRQLIITERGLMRLRLRVYWVYRDGGHTRPRCRPRYGPLTFASISAIRSAIRSDIRGSGRLSIKLFGRTSKTPARCPIAYA